jgi:hypothetical protein
VATGFPSISTVRAGETLTERTDAAEAFMLPATPRSETRMHAAPGEGFLRERPSLVG